MSGRFLTSSGFTQSAASSAQSAASSAQSAASSAQSAASSTQSATSPAISITAFAKNRTEVLAVLHHADGTIKYHYFSIGITTALISSYENCTVALIFDGLIVLESDGTLNCQFRAFGVEKLTKMRAIMPDPLTAFLAPQTVAHIEPFFGGIQVLSKNGNTCFVIGLRDQPMYVDPTDPNPVCKVGYFMVGPEMSNCAAVVCTHTIYFVYGDRDEVFIYTSMLKDSTLLRGSPSLRLINRYKLAGNVTIIKCLSHETAYDCPRVVIRVEGHGGVILAMNRADHENETAKFHTVTGATIRGFPGLVRNVGGVDYFDFPKDGKVNRTPAHYPLPANAPFSVVKSGMVCVLSTARLPMLNAEVSFHRLELLRSTINIITIKGPERVRRITDPLLSPNSLILESGIDHLPTAVQHYQAYIMQSSQFARPARPLPPSQSAQHLQPTQSARPLPPAQSAQSSQPSQSAQPSQSSQRDQLDWPAIGAQRAAAVPTWPRAPQPMPPGVQPLQDLPPLPMLPVLPPLPMFPPLSPTPPLPQCAVAQPLLNTQPKTIEECAALSAQQTLNDCRAVQLQEIHTMADFQQHLYRICNIHVLEHRQQLADELCQRMAALFMQSQPQSLQLQSSQSSQYSPQYSPQSSQSSQYSPQSSQSSQSPPQSPSSAIVFLDHIPNVLILIE